MQGTRVYLVRHGETEWNNSGRYQGHSDVALSSQGRRQAELLRERLRHISFDAVYSSDLLRARETAAIIAAVHGLNVKTDEAFREINFGAWEGLTYREIVAAFPHEWESWRWDPANVVIPGGESFRQVKERVWRAFRMMVEREKGHNLLLVAHGGSLRALICAVLGMDLTAVWRFRLDNTGVSIVDCYNGDFILALLNDSHHLETLGGPNESGIL